MASSQTQGETRHRGIDFLTTQRDKVIPVIDGYIFMAKDRGRKRFSCRTRTCHATVRILVDEIGPYYTGVIVHDHPEHEEVVNELKHRQELRVASRAKESQAVPTQQVVVDVRLKTTSTRRISTDARFVRRVRQKGNAPKTPADIVFDDDIKDTVLFHTVDNDIIIFGSCEMVKNASAVQMISIDGTFSRCPVTHFQLLTFHGVCNDGVSFPFAFALLQNKKSSSYVKTFCELDKVATKECGRSVFGRRDVVVSCDFERGLLKALEHFACTIKCCHFHMCQSIWRFVSKHGLASRYYTDASFRVRVRYLMMLPLLPHDKIAAAFRELEQYFPETDDGLRAVYRHFNDVWVNGFPVVIWCQYNELNRTNNVAEAFHSILARRLMKHHPQFPTFHAHIAALIAESIVKFNTHRMNPKSTTYAKELLNSKLRALVKNYLSGPPLALPLDQLLEVLFDRLHEKTRVEDLFEHDGDGDDGTSEGVPMELVDG